MNIYIYILRMHVWKWKWEQKLNREIDTLMQSWKSYPFFFSTLYSSQYPHNSATFTMKLPSKRSPAWTSQAMTRSISPQQQHSTYSHTDVISHQPQHQQHFDPLYNTTHFSASPANYVLSSTLQSEATIEAALSPSSTSPSSSSYEPLLSLMQASQQQPQQHNKTAFTMSPRYVDFFYIYETLPCPSQNNSMKKQLQELQVIPDLPQYCE